MISDGAFDFVAHDQSQIGFTAWHLFLADVIRRMVMHIAIFGYIHALTDPEPKHKPNHSHNPPPNHN